MHPSQELSQSFIRHIEAGYGEIPFDPYYKALDSADKSYLTPKACEAGQLYNPDPATFLVNISVIYANSENTKHTNLQLNSLLDLLGKEFVSLFRCIPAFLELYRKHRSAILSVRPLFRIQSSRA
ncbi:MAG: hypothetical protein OXD01_06850 [Gammaproteobacteria bacterium]|nr:hypothetical protein [Gammaproteobacteria bacterium]